VPAHNPAPVSHPQPVWSADPPGDHLHRRANPKQQRRHHSLGMRPQPAPAHARAPLGVAIAAASSFHRMPARPTLPEHPEVATYPGQRLLHKYALQTREARLDTDDPDPCGAGSRLAMVVAELLVQALPASPELCTVAAPARQQCSVSEPPFGRLLSHIQSDLGVQADGGSQVWDVHSALHNPNTPPPATPLVSGPVIRLPGQHGKVRRDGYRTTRP
jgi:hypothetical protein